MAFQAIGRAVSARCATQFAVGITPDTAIPDFDALDAAADLAGELHLDLCEVYTGRPCSCGIPGLITGLRDWAATHGLLETAPTAAAAS